jgi:hypothetical protein
MSNIPRPALMLALAGLIPFLAGALTVLSPGLVPTFGRFGGDADNGRALLVIYGVIIASFMSGCLWGFAARHGRKPGWVELGLGVVPPLFILFGLSPDDATSCLILTYAFAGLLLIECWFARRAVVVWWWLSLRIPLTVVVSICLLIGAFA